MGFGKNTTGEVPFSSHYLKSTCYLNYITHNVDLNYLAEVVFSVALHCVVTIFSFVALFFRSELLSLGHKHVWKQELTFTSLGGSEYTSYLEFFWEETFFFFQLFIHSVIYISMAHIYLFYTLDYNLVLLLISLLILFKVWPFGNSFKWGFFEVFLSFHFWTFPYFLEIHNDLGSFVDLFLPWS